MVGRAGRARPRGERPRRRSAGLGRRARAGQGLAGRCLPDLLPAEGGSSRAQDGRRDRASVRLPSGLQPDQLPAGGHRRVGTRPPGVGRPGPGAAHGVPAAGGHPVPGTPADVPAGRGLRPLRRRRRRATCPAPPGPGRPEDGGVGPAGRAPPHPRRGRHGRAARGRRLPLAHGAGRQPAGRSAAVRRAARGRLRHALPCLPRCAGERPRRRWHAPVGDLPADDPGVGATYRRALLSRYLAFPFWDGLIFPTVSLSELPQFTPIGVAQFSPLAAAALSTPADGKLRGVSLHHFGGFAKAEWRENDYLWGRLDGVELILRQLYDAGSAAPTAAATAPPPSTAGAVASAGGPVLAAGLRAVLDSEQGLTRIASARARLAEEVAGLLG
ncbi:DUF3376 domain-containing protein [Blastococcus brunescens]|uniref:DUF3376 domain-containing protein n=1 Tax=Blastococcus brunescens TaxID=1564165 RepID=UPI003BEEF27A